MKNREKIVELVKKIRCYSGYDPAQPKTLEAAEQQVRTINRVAGELLEELGEPRDASMKRPPFLGVRS